MGRIIAQATDKVGDTGSTVVEESQTLFDEIEFTEGLTIDRGYISPYFVKDQERQVAELINPKVLGYKTMAFIGVYLDNAMRNPEAVKALDQIPEVMESHYTTGDWSLLIKILCRDNEHLMQILNHKIQAIDGVSRTETFISLNQQIDRQIEV